MGALLVLLLGAFSASAEPPDAPAGPSAAQAQPEVSARPRRPRRRPRYKHLAKPAARLRLKGARWAPEVREALERLIATKGKGSKGYSADWPPVAVFALDDVAAVHHAGETVLQRLVERAEFKFSDEWWGLVPAAQRETARRAYGRFAQLPEAVWPQDADYLAWRKAMFEAYDTMCRQQGARRCRSWIAELFAGYTEAELESTLRDAVDDALREPLREEPVAAHAGDERPVTVRRGLRRIPEMTELIGALIDAQFDVWVLSSSDQWSAEALAARDGVDPTRVVGLRPRILNKRLRPEVIDPVPEGVGKAEAVTLNINRDPALVVAGPAEPELLAYGKGLRVAVDPGAPRFAKLARARGWLLQPSLPPGPPEPARSGATPQASAAPEGAP